MDQVKIGNFIANLRKEKNLTQELLGEKLGVTNKTISRWENGHYLPDIEMLQLLSKEFDVSINELIAGQRIQDVEYKEKAEENLIKALEDNVFTLAERESYFKRKWEREHLFEIILEIIVILAIILYCFFKDNGWQFIFGILGIILGVIKYNQKMVYIEKHVYIDKK